jgi:hypothetical protein
MDAVICGAKSPDGYRGCNVVTKFQTTTPITKIAKDSKQHKSNVLTVIDRPSLSRT